MAVVQRIATIALSGATGSRTWVATAAVLETAAGSSVVTTITMGTTGVGPPGDTDTLTIRYVDDAGNIIRSVTLANGSASQTDTFFFTSTGASGGSARKGTIEIKLQATKTTGGPTNTYDVETDGSPNTPPTGFTTSQLDRGWIRGTTTLTEAISNISLGGGKSSPAQYDESLFVRLTDGAASFVARALTVTLSSGSLSGATDSSATVTHDKTFTNVVDNRFPAASTVVGISVTVPNATLTGSPDWTYSSTTDDSMSVDPRLTCAHLLQFNSTTFMTPPLAGNSATGQRLATDLGELSTNIRAARGTVVGTATTGGVNGLTVHTLLQDSAQVGTASTNDDDTATKGGEAGWVQSFTAWSQNLPGGTWNKTVSITAPADITGASYLLNSSIAYVLLAADPAVRPNIIVEPKDFSGTVLFPGLALQVRFALFNTNSRKIVAQDASTAAVAITRYNKTTELNEYLDSDDTWQPTIVGGVEQAAYAWPMTDAAGDANVKLLDFTAEQTAGWSNAELQIVCSCLKDGTPYSDMVMIPVVDSKNRHDRADNVVVV